jgi:transposase-like protein
VDAMPGIEFGDSRLLVTRVLRPGSSISRLALAHGVNANLLRKWVGKRLAQGSAAEGRLSLVHVGAEGGMVGA